MGWSPCLLYRVEGVEGLIPGLGFRDPEPEPARGFGFMHYEGPLLTCVGTCSCLNSVLVAPMRRNYQQVCSRFAQSTATVLQQGGAHRLFIGSSFSHPSEDACASFRAFFLHFLPSLSSLPLSSVLALLLTPSSSPSSSASCKHWSETLQPKH